MKDCSVNLCDDGICDRDRSRPEAKKRSFWSFEYRLKNGMRPSEFLKLWKPYVLYIVVKTYVGKRHPSVPIAPTVSGYMRFKRPRYLTWLKRKCPNVHFDLGCFAGEYDLFKYTLKDRVWYGDKPVYFPGPYPVVLRSRQLRSSIRKSNMYLLEIGVDEATKRGLVKHSRYAKVRDSMEEYKRDCPDWRLMLGQATVDGDSQQ